MATIKKLYISSGVAVTAPTDLTSESSTVKIEPYADDAAFVTANGTAQEGDVYINTTIEGLRMYSAGAWRSVAMLSDPADATKVWAVDSTGATTGTSATFDFNQTASRVYTFPDVAGIVGLVPAAGPVRSNGSVLSTGTTALGSEVSGTLPIGNGGTGQTTANTALNALLPSQATNNGKYLQTDGTNTSWQPAAGGGGSESVLVVTNANYTVLDGDGYTTILVTTGASDRTITLPTLADNSTRVLRIKKIDSGAGKVIVDGEGSETIDGALTRELVAQYEEMEIQGDSEWVVLVQPLASGSTIGLVRAMTGRSTGNLGITSWSSGSASMTLARTRAYQLQDGQWRVQFNCKISVTGSSATNSGSFTLTGFTAKNESNGEQGICMAHQYQQMAFSVYISPNSGNCTWFSAGNLSDGSLHIFGDIEVESKPSWA